MIGCLSCNATANFVGHPCGLLLHIVPQADSIPCGLQLHISLQADIAVRVECHMASAISCPPAGAARSHSRLCMPPATTSVSALTYAASSDAKYATAAAMSPAEPSRPTNVCSSIAARASSDSVSDAANFVGTYPATGRHPQHPCL